MVIGTSALSDHAYNGFSTLLKTSFEIHLNICNLVAVLGIARTWAVFSWLRVRDGSGL
jgi:hypothetical protein